MRFNRYIWDLYASSEDGRQAIESHNPYIPLTDAFDGDAAQIMNLVQDHAAAFKVDCHEDSLMLLESLSHGLPLTSRPELQPLFDAEVMDPEIILANIHLVTEGLWKTHPEHFVPYHFQHRFDTAQQIALEFGIPMPRVPGKRNIKERFMYYGAINQAWQEFRRAHNLSSSEICAFLYHFAALHGEQSVSDLPSPSKVWLLMGGTGDNGDLAWLDGSENDSISHWQGSVDTRRGDILIMYCVRPYSGVHSIWRAACDGFVDPFFYYHSITWIEHPIKTPKISFKEMRNHPLLSENPYVRAHLQGPSGKPLTVEEYDSLLAMMEGKGFDATTLPRPIGLTPLPQMKIQDERGVEAKLVEPLLARLGYGPKDWRRQMPVRMGRGERYYPDYTFLPKTNKGEESARMILEAKHRINSERDLQEAYYQAKSYALRLQSRIIVLAALDGVWVFYQRRGGFSLEDKSSYLWPELENPDSLHRLARQIGKEAIRGSGSLAD